MKKLFEPMPRHGNVVLNFRNSPRTEFGIYASAYWRAARALAKQLGSARGYRDTDACPIVFLYRHAIELYMKATVICGRNLVLLSGGHLNSEGLDDHSVTGLVPAVSRIFEEMRWSWDTDAADVNAILKQLDQLDSHSFTFRYPTNKKGKSQVPRHFGFNVLEFASQAERALRLLDGALTGIEEAWDAAADAAAAQQGLIN